jgi:release factor glutamine methyltransferase
VEDGWTILSLIQWTTRYFRSKGIEQPRAGAELLLAHALGMERLQLYLNYDQPLKPEELTRYRDAIRRHAAREPVQYITGHQEFWSLELEVNPAVLIPRPETELLVENALSLLAGSRNRNPLVLELGTGSGAIAVALTHEHPTLRVIASDISPAALAVARRNAERHLVDTRIHFVAMDLFRAFISAPVFDLLVSNPPYITDAEFSELAPEISGNEPIAALRGGPQGLSCIRSIIADAHRHLRPEASLLLEIGQGQSSILAGEFAHPLHYEPARFYPDYSGILRVLHLQKRS